MFQHERPHLGALGSVPALFAASADPSAPTSRFRLSTCGRVNGFGHVE